MTLGIVGGLLVTRTSAVPTGRATEGTWYETGTGAPLGTWTPTGTKWTRNVDGTWTPPDHVITDRTWTTLELDVARTRTTPGRWDGDGTWETLDRLEGATTG